MASSTTVEVEVEGRRLKLTNLDKALYPATGFTKGQVIDYYTRIAPAVLPHLRRRTLTLKRYPNGVDKEFFFEKNAPRHRPEWIPTQAVYSFGNQRDVNFLICNELATLVWLGNLADLEFHTNLSLAADVSTPTMMVYDLDPGPPATIVECCRVGLMIRALLQQLGLECYPKTSGSKGLQLYIPLNHTPLTYEEHTKPFAHAVAELLEKEHPDLVLSRMSKDARTGKVFVDWSQNDRIKTTVCVYSLRARERPTVSTPLTWEEVGACAEAADPGLLVFETDQVLERVARHGDLFEPVLTRVQRLPELPGMTAKPARRRGPAARS